MRARHRLARRATAAPSPGASVREQILVGTFVDLAEALAADCDAQTLLALTCQRCATWLGDGTEVAIVVEVGRDSDPVVAASGLRARRLATIDVADGSSPCATSRASGARVAWQGDLDGDRRPGFTAEARALGIGSVQAMPLRSAARTVGVLVACREDHAPFAWDDALIAQAIGDVAATAIVKGRFKRDAKALTAQLQLALESRILVEQAKGIIAERAGITLDEAFRRLRAYARNRDAAVTDTARRVVDGWLPEADAVGPGTVLPA